MTALVCIAHPPKGADRSLSCDYIAAVTSSLKPCLRFNFPSQHQLSSPPLFLPHSPKQKETFREEEIRSQLKSQAC